MSNHEDIYHRRKVVVVGESRVGKSCLTATLARSWFPIPYYLTADLAEVQNVQTEVDGKLVKLELLDIRPDKDYDRVRPLVYPKTSVILICFSLDDPKSFQMVTERWHTEVLHFCSTPRVPLLLVGCKLDTRDTRLFNSFPPSSNGKDFITEQQGTDLAARIGALAYMECSMLHPEKVKELLDTVARIAVSWNPQIPTQQRRECRVL
ncbi:hypothetical protein M408DRAFT_110940 [Serendipita vermifera MAFF 305830]|uniref:Uncharacterized protein n=1 Tax=Serendipita vermifera MAFF 305830 TaxID=933852 RepID=A0A0C3AMD8_SERVB|nr:hypothetical protein M408DRAFT_110940 [Serendipita vermifera MAFF 305830]